MPENNSVIPNEHVFETCRPGTTTCCRYLTRAGGDWTCVKLKSGFRKLLDARVLLGDMYATGDNCEGIGTPEECEVPQSLADILSGGQRK